MKSDEQILSCSVDVDASLADVWQAWTTEEGARSFFAPQCRIECVPGGAYEMYFNPDAETGGRGGEGNILMALQSPHMLSFSWNFPPILPSIRDQRTLVTIRLQPTSPGITRVNLAQTGWGQGGEWEQGYHYFDHAWNDIVLPRLQRYFREGALDWSNLEHE